MLELCENRKCMGIYRALQHEGYIIEIIEVDDVYEAWISHEDYGAKSLMFGLLKKDVSYEKALVIVEGNLKTYIDIYKNEFED